MKTLFHKIAQCYFKLKDDYVANKGYNLGLIRRLQYEDGYICVHSLREQHHYEKKYEVFAYQWLGLD